MLEYDKRSTLSHFKQLADEKNRLNNDIRTNEEKHYKKMKKLLKILSQFNDAYENKKPYKIYESILSLTALLDFEMHDEFPLLIPESNIIQFFEVFCQEVRVREPLLLLFSILINLNNLSNNNVGIMIKNSFLDIIITFIDEIQNIKTQSRDEFQNTNIVFNYFKVIDSLILFSNNNTNSKISKLVMQAINFDFIFSLFDINKNEKKKKKNLGKLFEIVQNYTKYFQNTQNSISYPIYSRFLHIFQALLNEDYEDSYFFSEIFNTLASIINSNTIDQIKWTEFVELGYPKILSEFSIKENNHDYHLIQAASNCISACALHEFTDFQYNIDDVLILAKRYHSLKMYNSLFYAYTVLASKDNSLVDSFFTENINSFVDEYANSYKFALKKETAIFLASMIQLSQPRHVPFLIETKSILTYLYQLYDDSKDTEILSAILSSFSKIGSLLLSIYSFEQLCQIFSNIIPQDFTIEDNCDFYNEYDFENLQLIRNEFPFLIYNNFNIKDKSD